MSGIWLSGAALTIGLFLIGIFFTKKNVKTEEVEIYKWMIILNVIFSHHGNNHSKTTFNSFDNNCFLSNAL